MVTGRNNVDKFWSQVENQYQSRLDKIDQLVNTVSAQVKAENKTLVEVIQARNTARNAINQTSGARGDSLNQGTVNKYQQALGEYERQTRLFVNVVSEQYPELRSAQAFQDLRTEISGTDNRINVARKDFIAAATDYNNSIQTFPGNLFAGMFGFKPRGLFQAEAGASKRPEIPNNFNP